ncbi:MAG TPA: MlaD family protein [Gammaproteobacteria bacterium]|nr:MlaD family protein [Gammaproteobacteria bacterium]
MAEKEQVHYIHRLTYSARERLVGVFVLAAIVLLFLLLAFNRQTKDFFAAKFTLHAEITDAQGVTEDTPVMVYGLKVGEVSKLSLSPDNHIAVTMEILERFHKLIRTDSTAEISKLSVIGNAAISIKAGSPDKPMIPADGDLVMSQPMSVDQMLAQVQPVLQDVKSTLSQINQLTHAIEPADLNALMKNLAVVSGNLKVITGEFASPQGTANTSAAVQNLAGTLKELQARLAEVRPLVKNANAASADMPGLMTQTRKLVTQLNTTMGTVNYQLQALPDMVGRTRQILDETDSTLQAIQNTWPISSSVAKKPNTTLTPVQPPP